METSAAKAKEAGDGDEAFKKQHQELEVKYVSPCFSKPFIKGKDMLIIVTLNPLIFALHACNIKNMSQLKEC